MAKITITLSDSRLNSIEVGCESDVPFDRRGKGNTTPAQAVAVLLLRMIDSVRKPQKQTAREVAEDAVTELLETPRFYPLPADFTGGEKTWLSICAQHEDHVAKGVKHSEVCQVCLRALSPKRSG